ncbi:MAG TPA: S9 family peptidase [Ktedonobacterales bacterium]
MMTDHTPDFARYLNVRSAYGPSFSHDGATLAFLTDVTGVAEAWRVAMPADDSAPRWPDQLTFDGERISRVAYAPADNRLLLCGDRDGSELTRLYLLSPDGADLRQIAGAPNAICQFGAWSPDGQSIVYASNERDPRYFDICERNLATGETRAYALPDGTHWPERYSPDGRSILIARQQTPTRNQLILLDRETGAARPLTPEPTAEHAVYESAAWSGDGQSLYLLSDDGRDLRQLACLELATGAMRFLTDAPWGADALALSRDGGRLALATNENGYSRLEIYDVSAGWEGRQPLSAPDLGPCVLSDLIWSSDGRRLAFARESATAPLDVWTLDVTSGALTQATRSATGGVARDSFVNPTLVHFPTFDERQIPAFLFTPHGDHTAARPAVVFVHGGPESQFRPSFNSIVQYFVACGYVVLAPNVRGSAGYGHAYMSLDDVRLRMDSVADLRHAARWLIREGVADPRRIAVMGGSYGGFMTLAALTTYPDIWAAGVDIVGIANFVTFLEHTSAWRRTLREAEYGSLERDRDFLAEISPIHHVDRIAAPLFVAHGANDPRVPVDEAEQIVASLRERGRPVEYQRYEDEGHGLIKRANRLIAYPAIARFLREALG